MLNARRTLCLLLIPMVGGVILLRLYLHAVNPDTDLIIAGHEVHHLFIGTLLVLGTAFPIAFGVSRPRVRDALLTFMGLGAGMILDEFIYLIATPGTTAAYLCRTSVLGAVAMIGLAVVYLLVLARSAASS